MELTPVQGAGSDHSGSSSPRDVSSDAAGRFELLLDPGTWRVTASVQLREGKYLRAYLRGTVVLAAEQTLEQSFVIRLCCARLRVLGPDGERQLTPATNTKTALGMPNG